MTCQEKVGIYKGLDITCDNPKPCTIHELSGYDNQRGCFTPPTEAEIAALPRCATCGGIYPLECPPHRVIRPEIDAILATIEEHLSTGLGCRCEGWKIDTSQRPVDPRAQHRAHVAAVLGSQVARRVETVASDAAEEAIEALAVEAESWPDDSGDDSGGALASWLRSRKGPGCDCEAICSMGPTCPGAILAGLEGAGCHRVISPEVTGCGHPACDYDGCLYVCLDSDSPPACDNYKAPHTCLTTGCTTPCNTCKGGQSNA